jgi:hypothetical protein
MEEISIILPSEFFVEDLLTVHPIIIRNKIRKRER